MLFNSELRSDQGNILFALGDPSRKKHAQADVSILHLVPKEQLGFTLIEVLVALAVFAILATLTSSSMYYAFNTTERLRNVSKRVVSMQLAISMVERDTQQVAFRAVRGNDMRLFSAFIGQPQYIEFSRGGFTNPKAQEKRSTLQRVALICRENKLIRKRWASLDTNDRNNFTEKVLLKNLKKCQFQFLNHNLQILTDWQESPLTDTQQSEPFPKAIQLTIQEDTLGEGIFLFPLPGGLYDNI